ncbi:phosphodiester glycosidase family protein [Propionibacteriaceae bacterium Y1700]|uniref:phosphodiester glycosidase family protein n=1 Tax=Microlunatus sp. Y1700 TaxID=3418487 RepID=UPI003DA7101F
MSPSTTNNRRRSTAVALGLGVLMTLLSTVQPLTRTDLAAAAPPTGQPEPPAAFGPRTETHREQRPVAPGVTLTTFDQYGPDVLTGEASWLQGSLLTADLTGDVRLDRIFPGDVAHRDQLTTQANKAGAVAATNASYFDISTTGAPWGVGISNGEMVQSPHIADPLGACADCNVVITEEGAAAVGEILFEGTINLPGGGTARLDALNKPRFQIADGIMAFTPVWGSATRNRPVDDTQDKIEIVVTGGKVSAINPVPGSGELPDGSFTLVARGAGVDQLAGLVIGDPVSISYDFRTPDDQKIRAAASGRQILVADGVPQKPRVNSSDPQAHPRTAVGFSEDGKEMFMLTVDGRQPEFSNGVTLDELAVMMVDLGAHSAVNFDGGGSTTIVARKPGHAEVDLVNRPSEFDDDEVRPDEFTQRPVPDGLALFVPKGSGKLSGFWMETAIDPDRSPEAGFRPRLRTERVLPGLHRKLTATPHDETWAPANAPAPHWRSENPGVGRVDRNGLFTGRTPGTTTVRAESGRATGELALTVLKPLSRITASVDRIDLADEKASGSFDVLGHDADGYNAPIDPDDVTLDYDKDKLTVTVDADGEFDVTAAPFTGAQTITVTVGDHRTTVLVTQGRETVVVDDFSTTDQWDLWTMRATGTFTTTPDGAVGAAGRLDYDFTQSTETRGIGLWPSQGLLPVEGEPESFGLRINPDHAGLRLRLEISDALGQLVTVEAPELLGAGWQQVEFPVPGNLTHPVSLRRLYLNEINPAASYHGTVLVDELTAVRPLPAESKTTTPVVDPVVVHGTPADKGDWSYAEVSGLRLDAGDPDGPATRAARRALTEVRDSGAELVIINSGLVSEASAENFALATTVLDEELGDLPRIVVPGERERAGGSLEAFTKVFGQLPRQVDHRGTRFLLTDTSATSLRTSDWQQLPWLAQQLDRAASDSTVGQVVLVQGEPLTAGAAAGRQLVDRKEASTIEGWLTVFEERSGKTAAVLTAEGGSFGAGRFDGVPQLVNGAVAHDLVGDDPVGGFAGWTRIDVGAGGDGMRATFQATVDDLSLAAPAMIKIGDRQRLEGVLSLDDKQRAVAYPMGAVWSGSEELFVGDAEQAGPDAVAALDPTTGTLTGLRPGAVEVTLTLNGATATATVRVG